MSGRALRAVALPIVIIGVVVSAGMGACSHDNLGNGGDASANNDGGDDSGITACATQSTQAMLAPLDLLLLLDNSASMDYLGKWLSVKGAVQSFVMNPQAEGIGLGLQYYPNRATCDVSAYETPAVAIEELPANAMAVVSSMDARQMSGGTPIVPAFEGVYAYLKTWATQNPTHKAVLVLASDGAPDDSCIAPNDMGDTNSLANAVQLAMDAYTSNPPISTFVIGVGSETMGLNAIATAGGGTTTFVDTSTDIQGSFLAALNAIRGNALSCNFAVPPPSGSQMLDYTEVNVQFTPSPGAATTTFVNVGSASGCSQANGNGWYYDDPNMPTKVELCPGACSLVTAAASGSVNVIFGCKTIIL